jgi:phosphoribosylaminoimidazole-succinocarboxamide synthase
VSRGHPAVFHSRIASLPLVGRGKVRDLYALDEHHLLIVTTDRLSAFDVVMREPIPGKGEVLNTLSLRWFSRFESIVKNHLTGIDPVAVVLPEERDQVRGRSVVAMRLQPLPIEAVVRGYLIGSGWKDYQREGAVSGVRLPQGLQLASRLADPIFTPAAKAAQGGHDFNIDEAEVERRIGGTLAASIRRVSLDLYRTAAAFAQDRGILVADTKFEFGIDAQGTMRLMDEVLTPDSSRFWPADEWVPGRSPPSFDKQFVRDWLELRVEWNKTAPAPELPPEVIAQTAARYQEAWRRLGAE